MWLTLQRGSHLRKVCLWGSGLVHLAWGDSPGTSSPPSIQMGFNYKGPICHLPSPGST